VTEIKGLMPFLVET